MNNMEYINYQTGEKLDWNRVNELKDNAMLKAKPELWCEWDFEKNSKLGFDVYKVSKGSAKKVWWICGTCKSSYDATLNSKYTNNTKCSYCTGKRVNHTNSLTTKNPELAKQWHPTKNGELTPDNVVLKTNKKVWWRCEKGHEWEAVVSSRANGRGCPYCSNRKVLVGFNDMWTTDNALASLLVNPKNGYEYTKNSRNKVDWKCPKCSEIINKKIDYVESNGLGCSKCRMTFIVENDEVKYKKKYKKGKFNKSEFD